MKSNTLCIDTRLIEASGIGTYLKNLVPFLEEEPSLSVQRLGKDKIHSPIYSLQEQLEFPFVIPSCDLFWSPHFNVPLLPIRAKRRIVSIHDLFHLSAYSGLKFHERIYAKWLLSKATQASDVIFTISEFSKHEIVKHFPRAEEKIRVIPLGVDQTRFGVPLDLKLEEEVVCMHQIPEKYLLFVGNIKPHKNIEGLLKAFSLFLEREGEEYSLLLVGKEFSSFPIRKTLVNDPLLHKKVRFLSHISDQELPVFYKRASLVVLPSFYEGFGFPPLEAMSAKRPVIVSDIPVFHEVCGEGAYYICPHDPESLYEGFKKVLYDEILREELMRKGGTRALSFSWEKTREQHLKEIV